MGEIWCPTLGGTPTFIGLYGALAFYCPIILLFYYLIVLLSYCFIVLLFDCLIVPLSDCIVQYFTFSYLVKDNNNTPII